MATVIGAANPKDGSIWTTFEESVDTLKFYCSTSGSDSNDGLSDTTPKRTIAAVVNLRVGRDGKPDWILFKRGDTWTDEYMVAATVRSGRSADEPLVIGAYGDESLARPKFKISRGPLNVRPDGLLFSNVEGNKNDYTALVHLHVVGYNRDPDDPAFDATAPNMNLSTVNGHVAWRLVEGCRLDHCSYVHQKNGDDNPAGTLYVRNNTFNRVWNNWNASSVTAVYINSVQTPIFHNNIYVNCIWWYYEGLYGTVDVKVNDNGMSHSLYVQSNCGNGEYYYNIAYHTSDLQTRSSGIQRDNLLCQAPGGLVLSYNSTVGGASVGRTGTDVDGCVVLYGTDQLDSATDDFDHRADGPLVYGVDGGIYANCIFAHSEAIVTNRPSGILISSIGAIPTSNLTATGHKVFNIQSGTAFVIDAGSTSAGSSFDASNQEDVAGTNVHGWVDPDNGTIEGYIAYQLGEDHTRDEFFDLLTLQRLGAWNDAYAGYVLTKWIQHQYADASDWVNCYNGE
jgi:hypothetical protein